MTENKNELNQSQEIALLVDIGKITAMTDLLLVIASRHDKESEAYNLIKKEYEQIDKFLSEYIDACKRGVKL